jgi:hypothetical protein
VDPVPRGSRKASVAAGTLPTVDDLQRVLAGYRDLDDAEKVMDEVPEPAPHVRWENESAPEDKEAFVASEAIAALVAKGVIG